MFFFTDTVTRRLELVPFHDPVELVEVAAPESRDRLPHQVLLQVRPEAVIGVELRVPAVIPNNLRRFHALAADLERLRCVFINRKINCFYF